MGTFTTGELMRLIVLLALNIVLFEGIRPILMVPPFAIWVGALNLALFCTCVRPRGLNRGIVAALVAGTAFGIGAIFYMVKTIERPPLAHAILACIPDGIRDLLPPRLRTMPGISYVEFALFDGVGISLMALAGWMAWPRRPKPGTPPT
jgi:hypothetical protein